MRFHLSPVLLAGISVFMISLNVYVLYNSPDGTRTDDHLELIHQQIQEEISIPIKIPDNTILAGTENKRKDNNYNSSSRWLTIGISSVWRNENYIIQTINSLINESTPGQRDKEMFLFILVADEDSEIRAERAANLSKKYSDELNSGFMRILQPPDFLYPKINFTTIRKTYGDPPERIKWRTKQVLDFAFLFWYTWTRQPSQYYLLLEDDVICAKNYLQAIKEFVYDHRVYHWFTLQLSHFLGIGRLLRVSDLDRLVPFLLLFYKESPWDILLSFWSDQLMVPEVPPRHLKNPREHAVFQHIGDISTLHLKNIKGKKKIIDKSFNNNISKN